MTRYSMWQGRTPSNHAKARQLISAELSERRDGHARVSDSEGRSVRILIDNVLAHMVKYPYRWPLVPLIKPSIEEAYDYMKPIKGKNKRDRFYPSKIDINDPASGRSRVSLITHVTEASRRTSYWKTTHKLSQKDLDKKVGDGISVSDTNPSQVIGNPVPRHQGSTRSKRLDRSLVANNKYNPPAEEKSNPGRFLLMLGGLLALAYIGQQQKAA